MERLFNEDCNPKQLSPLTLAFIGDGVFDLFVRERLVCLANSPVKKLHQSAVAQVRCQAQAGFMKQLMSILTEEEIDIFKRGRNAHTSVPRNAEPADYHAATGFEAMFGYLYLKGDIGRLRQLFSIICEKSC